jgi:hypothetical protein
MLYFYFMQFYANSKWHTLKTILFFIVILLIAYLPVSSFLFFLKNDAFNGYFPPKFFMSESLHAGHLPLWNPYINFGIPQYGDMSSGYWSPVTWLIASTVGYNAYSFTMEVLLYILAGGIGFFQLTGVLKLNRYVRLISAVAYMCCGYNIGHLQHFNWLSGAAFLPWCCWCYLRMMQQFSLKNIAKAALIFYMLLASAHPGIIISAFYFFSAFSLYHFVQNKQAGTITKKIKQFARAHVSFLILLLLLSTGMIAGYFDLLPHFVRGEKISLVESLEHPSNAQSWISTLLPFATVKNDAFYNTDISMRSSYFSLTLLLFFILSLFSKKNSLQKFLLITGISFALLSTGGIFKTIAYKFIPLIGYVRLNGEFRIFALLCFILIASIELHKLIEEKKTFSGYLKWIYYAVEIILSAAIIFGIYKSISQKESFLYHISNISSASGLSIKLKSLIDSISFYDTLWIQGFIQLFLLWGIKWCLKFQNWQLLKNIVVADMVIACLLNIPFTGVGKASVAQVQEVLNKSPKGIPTPSLMPINQNDSVSTAEKGLVGDWSLYNKQIGSKEEVPYPIILKNMRAYFEKDAISKKENHLDKPFIFSTDTSAEIKIHSFASQKIELEVSSQSSSQLILQQNFYPNWYYYNGSVKKEMNQYGINFMSMPLEKGVNKISITFEPSLVKTTMLFSLILFVLCCLALIFIRSKPSSLS